MREYKEIVEEWNDMHCKFVAQRNNAMADHCEKNIAAAKHFYYAGTPIMSDKSFDWLEDKLKVLRPDSSSLKRVGASTLPIPKGFPKP
jgi:NAD-dependent DNA ligase